MGNDPFADAFRAQNYALNNNSPFGGIMAGQAPMSYGVTSVSQYVSVESYRNLESMFHRTNQHVMDLQGEIIRLQRELDKIKNTKEWLVGPDQPCDNKSIAGIPGSHPIP